MKALDRTPAQVGGLGDIVNPVETARDRPAAILAVILNWNGARYLRRCVEHLLAQRGAEVKVLVVDNGSTDDSLKLISDLLPASGILKLETNQGFAEGMNAGLRRAQSDAFECVWLVNTDAFPDPDCLRTLLDRMSHDPSLMMVTPRLLSEDRTEQHAGGTIDWSNGTVVPLRSAELTQQGGLIWLTGTAPLIRTAILSQVGLFEPAFFAYWEDLDLSIRIERAGGALAAIPEATAIHVGNASSGSDSPIVQFLETRNAWLFLERNAGAGSSRARWLRFVARAMQRAALYQQKAKPGLAAAVLAGISAARRGRYGRPDSNLQPGPWDRLTSQAPWQWSRALTRLAGLIEPIPAAAPTRRP